MDPQHTWLVVGRHGRLAAGQQATLLGPAAQAVVTLGALANVLALPVGTVIATDLAGEELLARVGPNFLTHRAHSSAGHQQQHQAAAACERHVSTLRSR